MTIFECLAFDVAVSSRYNPSSSYFRAYIKSVHFGFLFSSFSNMPKATITAEFDVKKFPNYTKRLLFRYKLKSNPPVLSKLFDRIRKYLKNVM